MTYGLQFRPLRSNSVDTAQVRRSGPTESASSWGRTRPDRPTKTQMIAFKRLEARRKRLRGWNWAHKGKASALYQSLKRHGLGGIHGMDTGVLAGEEAKGRAKAAAKGLTMRSLAMKSDSRAVCCSSGCT